MDSESRRRSVKVVRVLCDGCERASAVSYCNECNETACHACVEQLHVRGRRQSKRSPPRSCKGRAMRDLQKTVGVLALCKMCRARPAYRYNNAEVYPLCNECRHSYSKSASAPAQDIVKRAIADDLSRSSKPSSMSHAGAGTGASGSSRRRPKHSSHHSSHGHHKSRRERRNGEDESTGDDMGSVFSRESSAE